MKKKFNIFDEDRWREIEKSFEEAAKRMEETGKSPEEILAEMAEEERKEAELQSDLECYIRMALCREVTTLIVDTGTRDVKRMVCDAVDKIGVKFGDAASIKLSQFDNCKMFWQHLLNLRKDILWIVWDGVENVTDEYIQQCILYMMKREEYVPAILHAVEPIDFDKLRLIIITKAEIGIKVDGEAKAGEATKTDDEVKADDETQVYPPYCRGYSTNTVVIKV